VGFGGELAGIGALEEIGLWWGTGDWWGGGAAGRRSVQAPNPNGGWDKGGGWRFAAAGGRILSHAGRKKAHVSVRCGTVVYWFTPSVPK